MVTVSSDSFGFLCFKLQKWCFTEADHKVSEIQGILELSVQRSSCERDHNKNRLFVYIKEDGTSPLSTSSTGNFFNCYSKVCVFLFIEFDYILFEHGILGSFSCFLVLNVSLIHIGRSPFLQLFRFGLPSWLASQYCFDFKCDGNICWYI